MSIILSSKDKEIEELKEENNQLLEEIIAQNDEIQFQNRELYK